MQALPYAQRLSREADRGSLCSINVTMFFFVWLVAEGIFCVLCIYCCLCQSRVTAR